MTMLQEIMKLHTTLKRALLDHVGLTTVSTTCNIIDKTKVHWKFDSTTLDGTSDEPGLHGFYRGLTMSAFIYTVKILGPGGGNYTHEVVIYDNSKELGADEPTPDFLNLIYY